MRTGNRKGIVTVKVDINDIWLTDDVSSQEDILMIKWCISQ